MRTAVALLLVGALTFASDSTPPLVSNGTFDSGAYDGWTAKAWLYNGRQVDTPARFADLGLTPGGGSPAVLALYGNERTFLPNSLVAPPTDTPPMVPFAGTGAVGINLGNGSGNATSLSTTLLVDPSHFDPTDGLLRIRLRALPTFVHDQNMARVNEPFVFFTVDNVTTNTNDIASFYLGQNTVMNNGLYYQGQSTGGYAMQARYWIDVPLRIHLRDAREGDTLRLTAIACGAAPGFGAGQAQLYLDSVEAKPTRPMISGYAPQNINLASTYNVTFVIDHGSEGSATPVSFSYAPTFTPLTQPSVTPPWTCTANNSGLSCQASSLPAGQRSTVTLQMRTGYQTGYFYSDTLLFFRDFTGSGTLLPSQSGLDRTAYVVNNSRLTKLAVASAVDASSAIDGDGAIAVTVTNASTVAVTGITLTDVASAALSGRSYVCTATGTAQINGTNKLTGTGALSTKVSLPANGQVRCIVRIPADAAPPTTLLRYGAVIDPPAGVVETTDADDEDAVVFRLSDIAVNAVTTTDNAPRDSGTACRTNAQCTTGFCSDGVCCQTACDGPCEACNVQGAIGTCTLISGESRTGHVGCGPYVCHAGACDKSCDTDSDCVSLYHCAKVADANTCVADANVCRVDSDCPTGRYCTPAQTCESPTTQDPTNATWRLGGGCQSNADGVAAVLGLAPLLVWRRSRRRSRQSKALWIALFALVLPGVRSAHAASPLAMPLERLQILGGRNDVFNVASARIAQQTMAGHGQINLQYLATPLRLRNTRQAAQTTLVPHLAAIELAGGAMFRHGFEFDAVLPLYWHDNHAAPFVDAALDSSKATFGLGDVRLTPKWSPFPWKKVHLGLAVPVGILTSRGGRFLSVGGVSVTPRLMFEALLPGHLSVLVNAGFLFRPKRQVIGLVVQDAIHAAAALAWVLPKRAHAFTLLAGSWAEIPVGGSRHGSPLVEGLIGLRARLVREWSVEATYGGPFAKGPGVPSARAMLSVRYAERSKGKPMAPEAAPPVAPLVVPEAASDELAGPPYTPPALGDVVDVPLVAPTLEPPPPVSIPFVAPVPPPPGKDAASLEEEAMPLLLPNLSSKAPPRRHVDRDKDGAFDLVDKCPDVPGTKLGCPATLALANKALAHRPVHYVIENRYAVFDAAAQEVMEEIRQVLVAYPRAAIRIVGHVPPVQETPEAQRDHLSMRRAEDVAHWLTLRGIAKQRMRLEGHGSREALDASGTPEALAKNRRIEVRLE